MLKALCKYSLKNVQNITSHNTFENRPIISQTSCLQQHKEYYYYFFNFNYNPKKILNLSNTI